MKKQELICYLEDYSELLRCNNVDADFLDSAVDELKDSVVTISQNRYYHAQLKLIMENIKAYMVIKRSRYENTDIQEDILELLAGQLDEYMSEFSEVRNFDYEISKAGVDAIRGKFETTSNGAEGFFEAVVHAYKIGESNMKGKFKLEVKELEE